MAGLLNQPMTVFGSLNTKFSFSPSCSRWCNITVAARTMLMLVSPSVSSAEHEASVLSLCCKTVCVVFISSIKRRLSRTITACPSLCSPGGAVRKHLHTQWAEVKSSSFQRLRTTHRGDDLTSGKPRWCSAGSRWYVWQLTRSDRLTCWHCPLNLLEQYCKLLPTWSVSLFIDVWVSSVSVKKTDWL